MTRLVAMDRSSLCAMCLKGARMPSMAEELATDLSTVRLRTAGSRRNRLAVDSLELMGKVYQGMSCRD